MTSCQLVATTVPVVVTMYIAIIHWSTNGKSICTMQKGIALANIDMHAHDSSLINNYQHHVIKTVHRVILKISQQICTVFRAC